MTAMPIARAVLSGDKIMPPALPAVAPEKVPALIADAKHFNVQVAGDLFWLTEHNGYRLDHDFGAFRLPFPTVWMEWLIPAEVIVKGNKTPQEPLRIGVLLREEEVAAEHGYVIGATTIMADDSVSVMQLSPLLLQFELDLDGRPAGNGLRYRYDKNGLDETGARRYYTADAKHFLVAGLALNLIHCKNVTTEVVGHVPVRRSGAQKRRGEPKIEYRTIRVPGSPCGGEATDENVGIMPHHRVRGHFKTFTEEAPLLGKCTGTYWWGWQVRGKKENGEIISDYKVTA